MCRSQGRESLVHNGGLLWVVKSGWNMVQGPGSGGVSHEAGGPCGQAGVDLPVLGPSEHQAEPTEGLSQRVGCLN